MFSPSSVALVGVDLVGAHICSKVFQRLLNSLLHANHWNSADQVHSDHAHYFHSHSCHHGRSREGEYKLNGTSGSRVKQ